MKQIRVEQKRQAGFSLTEVMIAMSIMGVMGMVATSVGTIGLNIDKQTNETTEFHEVMQALQQGLKDSGSCYSSFKKAEKSLPTGTSLPAVYSSDGSGSSPLVTVGDQYGTLKIKAIRLEASKRVSTNVILSFLTVTAARLGTQATDGTEQTLQKSLPIMFNVARDGSVAGCTSANLMQDNLSLNEKTAFCQITKGSGYYYNPATNNCLQPPSLVYQRVVGMHDPALVEQVAKCDVENGWTISSCSYGYTSDSGNITLSQTFADGTVKTQTIPPVKAIRYTGTHSCGCIPAVGVEGAYCIATCAKEYTIYDLPAEEEPL